MKQSHVVLLVAVVSLLAGTMACSSGGENHNAAANCLTTYSGQIDSCTVGAICSGTIYRADCQAQPDGGLCVCDVIDAGPSKTVAFVPAICTPLASNNDPTPNVNAANGACGWGL